jgi:hypothetical protein
LEHRVVKNFEAPEDNVEMIMVQPQLDHRRLNKLKIRGKMLKSVGIFFPASKNSENLR